MNARVGHVRSWLVAVVVALLAVVGRAAAAPPAPDETKYITQLQSIAPDAVPIFVQANTAREAGDLPTAISLYEQVATLAPAFTTASRRAATSKAQSGQTAGVVDALRKAYAAEPSVENQTALAVELVALDKTRSPVTKNEAMPLIMAAIAKDPGETFVWQSACQIAVEVSDNSLLKDCSRHLDTLAADDVATWMFRMYACASNNDAVGARAALDGAHARGLPDATYNAIVEQIDRKPWPQRALRAIGAAFAAWFVGFAVLLLLGDRLNKRALASVNEPARQAHPAPGELRLRHLYRRVLFVACVAYYLSLPLVALSLLLVAAGVVLAVLAAGFIAIKLFVILAIVVFGTFVSIVKAIFIKTKEGEEDALLDLAANPKFDEVLREVARAVGTRPVDRVILTPGTEVAVFDRGQLSTQLRGKGERCLLLGVGVLEGMDLRSFKAVLAHEYGHFKNEDTSGFGFALAVRRSLHMMIIQLVARRVATPINPAWWFVRGFSKVFLRISQGASRLQEVLADRAAAFAYGSAAFEKGLRHVIDRGVRFGANVTVIVKEVTEANAGLPNLYAFVPTTALPDGEAEAEIAKQLEREPSETDSHPAPRDRFKWVRALDTPGSAPHESDGDPAWSLFADRPALESSMTAVIRARLRERRGLVIAAS